MKTIPIAFVLSFLAVSTFACDCEYPGFQSYKTRADNGAGIYYVALTNVSGKPPSTSLNLKFLVLETLKGPARSEINGLGFAAKLPELRNGEWIENISTCDYRYTYGATFYVMANNNRDITVAACSESLIPEEWLDRLR